MSLALGLGLLVKGETGLRGSVLHSSTRIISVLGVWDSMTGRKCNISLKNVFVELLNAIFSKLDFEIAGSNIS